MTTSGWKSFVSYFPHAPVASVRNYENPKFQEYVTPQLRMPLTVDGDLGMARLAVSLLK
jgi:hypothetical protein